MLSYLWSSSDRLCAFLLLLRCKDLDLLIGPDVLEEFSGRPAQSAIFKDHRVVTAREKPSAFLLLLS